MTSAVTHGRAASWWAPHAWVHPDGAGGTGPEAGPSRGPVMAAGVRLRVGADGRTTAVETGTAPAAGDRVLDGVVLPGAVDAHSHAFHRLLRGRTHAGEGSFWTWRELMYASAQRLDPASFERVATACYAEMAVAGWTSVAEFHYLHHDGDGRPYGSGDGTEPHAMERALVRAAAAAGLRLTLLDTAYLAGGLGRPLLPEQVRFSDGSPRGWLDRLASLRDALAADGVLGGGADDAGGAPAVVLGAALHSVRAVPVDALGVLRDGVDAVLGADAPLHVHLSEQVAENEDCLAATGLTPTGLLAAHGLLGPRLSAVHATHLTAEDVALLGGAGATVVMCPTTEADLGDGVGPARALADAGATIALGSDQHAVLDPFLEARALEHGERLASQRRGRFSPTELLAAATSGGQRATGRALPGSRAGVLAVGEPCDLVVVDPRTARTAGCEPEQLLLAATSADVLDVLVGGRAIASRGTHLRLGDPGGLLLDALEGAGA